MSQRDGPISSARPAASSVRPAARALAPWLALAALSLGGCFLDDIACDGDYLFQSWVESSSDGGTPPPFLDLTRAHYGPGQTFYIGACTYAIDIESDDTDAAGTFSFSRPTPPSATCIANEATETYTLSCGQLVVNGPHGTVTFVLASPDADGGTDGGS